MIKNKNNYKDKNELSIIKIFYINLFHIKS